MVRDIVKKLMLLVVCILLNVFATLQGTMFFKTLIDDFITPLLSQTTLDYGPLLQAMMKVAVFYGIGIVAAYLQNRLLITISQGSIKQTMGSAGIKG